MKVFTLIITSLFLLPVFVFAQDSTQVAPPVPDSVLVKKVISGTAFTTDDGRTITLLGLSVPTSQAVSAEDAKEHLAGLIEGKTLVLEADSLAPADTKKTVLRYAYDGSTLINLTLIEEGYADLSAAKHSLAGTFKQTQSEAKADHRGAYATERSTAVQCSGITQKGTRCKRTTTSLSGKCWQHQ